MGRRPTYYIDPIAFLLRQVKGAEDMDEEVRQYGVGLLSWWSDWADEYGLELPEREVVSDIVRAHLGGAAMKPDAMTRARILGSVDKAVRGIRQRMRHGARKVLPPTRRIPPMRRETAADEAGSAPARDDAVHGGDGREGAAGGES